MTDILLEKVGAGWDLALDANGDLQLTHNVGRATEIGQRVLYTLATWYGECPYDVTAGIPYLELIFGTPAAPPGGPIPGAVAYITQLAVETEGVDALADTPTFTLDSNRTLTVSLAFTAGADTIVVGFEVTP